MTGARVTGSGQEDSTQSDHAKAANGPPRPSPPGGSDSDPCQAADPDREAVIDQAIALFAPLYGRTIDREEARQMTMRLTGFFDLLAEWEQNPRGASAEGDLAA